jgi:DNA-binding protein H-NS
VPASLPPNGGGAENRRSTRVIHAVPVTIRAQDALGQSFEEFTSTVTVNCNGCKYESKHYIPKGSGLTIEIGPRQRGSGSRIFPARVVWVQRPRNYREIFHIAVEFEVPGNVWDIKVPPKDWFPHPDDEELIIPVYPEEGGPVPVLVASVARAQNLETENGVAETAHAFLAESTLPTPSEATSLAPAAPWQSNQPELKIARQIVRSNVEAAIIEEIVLLRQDLESQLQAAVQETIKSLSERIVQRILTAVTEQATEQAAASVVAAHQNLGGNMEELGAKVRLAAQEALNAQAPRKSPARKRARKAPKQANVT